MAEAVGKVERTLRPLSEVKFLDLAVKEQIPYLKQLFYTQVPGFSLEKPIDGSLKYENRTAKKLMRRLYIILGISAFIGFAIHPVVVLSLIVAIVVLIIVRKKLYNLYAQRMERLRAKESQIFENDMQKYNDAKETFDRELDGYNSIRLNEDTYRSLLDYRSSEVALTVADKMQLDDSEIIAKKVLYSIANTANKVELGKGVYGDKYYIQFIFLTKKMLFSAVIYSDMITYEYELLNQDKIFLSEITDMEPHTIDGLVHPFYKIGNKEKGISIPHEKLNTERLYSLNDLSWGNLPPLPDRVNSLYKKINEQRKQILNYRKTIENDYLGGTLNLENLNQIMRISGLQGLNYTEITSTHNGDVERQQSAVWFVENPLARRWHEIKE